MLMSMRAHEASPASQEIHIYSDEHLHGPNTSTYDTDPTIMMLWIVLILVVTAYTSKARISSGTLNMIAMGWVGFGF